MYGPFYLINLINFMCFANFVDLIIYTTDIFLLTEFDWNIFVQNCVGLTENSFW